MTLTILAASVALLAGGAPPSAVVSQVNIQPLPASWDGRARAWEMPAVAEYGDRLMTGAAETGPLRGRLVLTDLADPAFVCRGGYDNRRRAPRLDLTCSDGARIAMTFQQPSQGRGFGEGMVGETKFRFRFGTDLAAR